MTLKLLVSATAAALFAMSAIAQTSSPSGSMGSSTSAGGSATGSTGSSAIGGSSPSTGSSEVRVLSLVVAPFHYVLYVLPSPRSTANRSSNCVKDTVEGRVGSSLRR